MQFLRSFSFLAFSIAAFSFISTDAKAQIAGDGADLARMTRELNDANVAQLIFDDFHPIGQAHTIEATEFLLYYRDNSTPKEGEEVKWTLEFVLYWASPRTPNGETKFMLTQYLDGSKPSIRLLSTNGKTKGQFFLEAIDLGIRLGAAAGR